MAAPRTLKGGRLYLLTDGSASGSFAQASTLSGGWFRRTDGKFAALVQETADLFLYSGGSSPAAIQAATPSASINPANTCAKTCSYQDGSRTHVWYGYDEGSSAYDIHYTYSDNNGSTFAAAVDLGCVGDASWCNDAVWPVFFEFEGVGTDLHRLWCVGNNGGTYTLGYFIVNTVTSGLTADIDDPTKYIVDSTGATLTTFDRYVAAVIHKGALYAYHRVSDGISLSRSRDNGQTWEDLGEVFAAGVSGTTDDSAVYPQDCTVHRGAIHLMYVGNDGSTRIPKLAVGEVPDKLYKVPWADVDTFGSSDLLTGYSADLTFAMPDLSVHVPKRLGPGALIDGPFVPTPLSFTLRHAFELSSTSDEFGWLASLVSPDVGTDSVTAQSTELGLLNLAYIVEDDDGNPADFWLFPMVGIQDLSTQEGAEGNTINVTGVMHAMRHPLYGSVE